jgi:Ras-related protein Rab-8A
MYYRGAQGIAIVYDITNRQSFERVRYWYAQCCNEGDEGSRFLLIGNKVDLEDERKVSEEDGRALAEELGANFIETSAKANMNVADAFRSLSLDCLSNLFVVHSTSH